MYFIFFGIIINFLLLLSSFPKVLSQMFDVICLSIEFYLFSRPFLFQEVLSLM